MKQIFFLILFVISLGANAQSKLDYAQYNNLTEVEGTPYMIASIEERGKMAIIKTNSLLFVNSETGETTEVDFSESPNVPRFEQIKIDSLNINLILVSARTVDLDGKKGIDWNDPIQIIILSTDGKERTQLTDDKLYVRNWVVNKEAGTIVVSGYYDTNNNGKYDKTDKAEIAIYDLKTFKLISRI